MRRKYKFIVLVCIILTFMYGIIHFGYAFFLKKAYPIEYYDYVSTNADKYNVDRELILAVIKSESNFRQDVQSNAGAIGLMQIMPDTFDWLQTHDLMPYMDVGHLKDPKTNVEYGTYLLSILKKKYGTIIEVICAYNAGIGTVDRWLKDERYSSDGKVLKTIPYPDTAAYVSNVLKSSKMYKVLYFNN